MNDNRPYVDRPIGDLARAATLARRATSQLGLPDPALVRVGMNALFRAGTVMVRVGRPTAPARLSLDLAAHLHLEGIACPSPAADEVFEEGELAATCWELVESTGADTDWTSVGEMVARVHTLEPAELPIGYPLPSPSSFPWWDFDALLIDVGNDIDDAARTGLEDAVERNRGWADFAQVATVVCHGDVHPGNVIMGRDGPVLLDWDLMCLAPPAWDHAMLLTFDRRWGGDTDAYRKFADGYGTSLRSDAVAECFAELRNVAATLMRVRAGRTDRAAYDEAHRRLRYWRGDLDAPAWTAQ